MSNAKKPIRKQAKTETKRAERKTRCVGEERYPGIVDSAKEGKGICADITVNRDLEEEERSAERLYRTEKMEALGTFAGGVAHDLNNVLSVLAGYSELLLDKIPEGNPIRRYACTILQASEKGAAIMQELITLARRGIAVSDVINLNTLIADSLATPVFEKLKSDHPAVTFLTDLDHGLLKIKGSRVHLEKAVLNLLSNAVEAISTTGEVTVRTENRHIDKMICGYDKIDKGDYVMLTVSDTGEDIKDGDIDRIFEPFYTKKVMGRSRTGLGLAVVWGIVKDHKGYIDVKSEKGKGSTFALYFPVMRED